MHALKRFPRSAETASLSRRGGAEAAGARLSPLPVGGDPALRAPRPLKVVQESPETEQFACDLIIAMKALRGYALWLSDSVSHADDLIQDALLNAWNARDRFERGTNLNAWCRTILRNLHFSQLRRSWRILPLADEAMASLPATGGNFTSALDLLAVRNGLALLPVEQREALLLIGVGGMSYIEAARLSDCAIGTMKSRVSRARGHLSMLMSENRAGFNSDADLRAGDAMADLLHQVDLIRMRAAAVSPYTKAVVSVNAVLSEAAPAGSLMLRTG